MVDLHLHTTASDGCLSSARLIDQVGATSLRVVAITDHDTTGGLPAAFERLARYPQLRLIPGIELSAESDGSEVHLLGYFIDIGDPDFQSLLIRMRESRADAARRTVEKLRTLGVHISWERVLELANGAVGRPHIARAMLEAGYIKSMQDAFDRYLGDNGIARVPRQKLTALEAVQLVHRLGGAAAIAHPRTVDDVERVVAQLAEAGLDGIEVYAEKYMPEQRAQYQQLAGRNGLLECGGSDYHANGTEGEVIPGAPGVLGPALEVPDLLLERARSRTARLRGSAPR
ncbi:MAG: PHP domain-containing protein [Chloroflexi bacterium]|nr:PHP domain-containing protein [Chloroflexota bacterium]